MKPNRFNIIILCLLLCGLPLEAVKAADTEEVLTWGQCISEAKKNHPDLISAAEVVNQQKAGKDITASGLYPQVSGDVNASTAKTSSTASSTGTTANRTTHTYSYGVTGTQLIFDGFKTINDVKGAAENIKAAQQGYSFTSSEVRLSLRTAFVNLLKAQELIRVTDEIVKIRRENLELITLRYMSGLEHKGALMTAEANMAEAEFEAAQARRDVELAQRQLTKEMGRKDFRPMAVNGDFIVRDPAQEKPAFESFVKNNPSLLQAVAKTNAAAFAIRAAYGNFSPTLSGDAGADRTSSHWPPDNNQWNAGLGVSMPIFEGGLRTAQVAQAQAAYNQAEADERSLRDKLIVGLEQTWVSLQDAITMVNVQLKSLNANEERSKIAEAQYSTGFITFDNWIIIEDDLVSAKKNYLQGEANSLQAEANWIQAKGETLEYAQ
ncbi:MAG: TolC family protein [Candidatus Omnitrophica bacterium]|nr:TolC family protein [Candidatus Omnitrophota bacterium]